MGTALCKTSVGNARPVPSHSTAYGNTRLTTLVFPINLHRWQWPHTSCKRCHFLAVAADWPIDEGARNCATTKMPWQPKAR